MKAIRNVLSLVGLCFSLPLLHGQSAAIASFNGIANPVEPTTPDSIVQITAEARGLQLLSPDEVAASGTFWWILPGGTALPSPFAPPTLNVPIYQLANGKFLVDETGGQVPGVATENLSNLQSADVANTAMSDLEAEATTVVNLINQAQTTAAQPQVQAMDMGVPSIPSNDGTNSNSPDGVTNNFPGFIVNYGTNLWIGQVAVYSGNVTGIISNTSPGVRLELEYTFDLTLPWQSADWYVYGSESTNWTAWSVPVVGSSNLFLRVRSWAVDANGLPIWWEQQYGLANVDANTLDSSGDGWTIYQDYALGVVPGAWATPGTPQGLTVTFNQSAMTASISWIPSRGNVVNYTLEKSYQAHAGGSAQVNDYTVSGTSYPDSISGNKPDVANGNAYDITYRVKANYQNEPSTAWTPAVPLQQTTVAAAIMPGPSGLNTVVTMGVPASAALVRLVFIDENAVSHNDDSDNYNGDIPVSSITNNMYLLPTAWVPPANDSYGSANYAIFAESVDSSGNSSAPTPVTSTNWVSATFYDGREQLKENLVFQLRAAPVEKSFSFYFAPDNDIYGSEPTYWYNYPTNYACAGLYPYTGPEYVTNEVYSGGAGIGYGGNYGGMDIFQPFGENCLFRNFVFSYADLDQYAYFTTGVGWDISGQFELQNPITYEYSTNDTHLPDLLSANASRWIFANEIDGTPSMNADFKILYAYGDSYTNALFMSTGFSNWFGLPYISAEVAYGNTPATSATLLPGGEPVYGLEWGAPLVCLETGQPELTTVKYCFYKPQYDWLPGSPYFSPTDDSPMLMVWAGGATGWYATNDVPYLIVPTGTWTQLAGYAKQQLLNGAPDVYGYLGQYFQAAYQLDGNENVTTNSAGVVSPYGYYFPTAVGTAALVTMPDPDTGQQGTCMVYSVSLALDKNHDGNMDLSVNGPDATSANSPYVFFGVITISIGMFSTRMTTSFMTTA